MDLTKTFCIINQNLSITKFVAYGFGTDAQRYMKSHLRNRKQRVRMNKILTENNLRNSFDTK